MLFSATKREGCGFASIQTDTSEALLAGLFWAGSVLLLAYCFYLCATAVEYDSMRGEREVGGAEVSSKALIAMFR